MDRRRSIALALLAVSLILLAAFLILPQKTGFPHTGSAQQLYTYFKRQIPKATHISKVECASESYYSVRSPIDGHCCAHDYFDMQGRHICTATGSGIGTPGGNCGKDIDRFQGQQCTHTDLSVTLEIPAAG